MFRKKKPGFIISKSSFDAVLFDLDGVVTKTAKVHAASWKKLFDEYLKKRAALQGGSFKPFDSKNDYRKYVDGRPRYEGIKNFLASRGIALPYGTPDDPSDKETICGLGNRKNIFLHEYLEKNGVETYELSIKLIYKLKAAGIKTAIVSSSKNCAVVLKAAKIYDLFDVKVDGVDSLNLNLKGKPAPDIFLEAAQRLGVTPARAIVVEDAIAGVQAGRQGNFGCVIGVDRIGQSASLKASGAEIVVGNLSQISVDNRLNERKESGGILPSALEAMDEIRQLMAGKPIFVFLDYDGTLTPIVERPELAVLSDDARETVSALAAYCQVAVISGRDLQDVQNLVGIDNIFYAGSHGFDIAGPRGQHIKSQQGLDFLPVLSIAEQALRNRLHAIAGVLVERKKFSIAVHYRRVAEQEAEAVETAVDQVLADHNRLRKGHGKKVYELQPKIDWHKGKALLWLLEHLGLRQPDVLPLYIGDDTTDEDAFNVLIDWGVGILVRHAGATDNLPLTAARYVLEDPGEVMDFLRSLISILKGGT
ncbi:MAG: trehalose-phosphatase [Proteobacteria bacterium]|nr:trehalose-phosphatase [Pseudomonadota bacterium]MBU4013517.1 trehalose-phosphatase [Pseudomonadota bacterium]MBU4068106.1 trehalose-phosphatase [Pseudomonadota bacterium]MBU4127773.1 trehalose-phosphatase [Pseudomonadota bacterium]